MIYSVSKVKAQKNTPRKIQMAKSKLKHIKRMDNNCHIRELVQAFSYVEKSRWKLVL